MEYGPVDVVVVAAGEPQFDGAILNELHRLAQAGTVRLLDAMVLLKGEDGIRTTLDIEDLPVETRSALGLIETGTRGMFDAADAEVLFEGMCPGSAVVALAIEHAWARPLVKSFYDAGAEVALQYRIPAAVVNETLAAVAAAQ
jgi:hypothetical protein